MDPSGQIVTAEPFQQGGHLLEIAAAENVVLEREHDARAQKDGDHLTIEFRVLGGMEGRFLSGVRENSS